MENIKLFLKGSIIGIGKIIPGVSGAMIAISLGVYEKCLNIIGNITKINKKDFKYIFIIVLGILFSMVLTSKIVIFFLNKYYLQTMLLFSGLILGGMPSLFKNIKNKKSKKNILILIITVIIMILLSFINCNKKIVLEKNINNFVSLLLSGFLDAISTVVPGISGTALLMIFGYYNIIISAISNILNISNIYYNLFVLSPFIIGLIIGIILVAKIISYLFSNYRDETYFLITGFALSSIIILMIKTFDMNYNLYQLIIGIFLLIIGYFTTKKLES